MRFGPLDADREDDFDFDAGVRFIAEEDFDIDERDADFDKAGVKVPALLSALLGDDDWRGLLTVRGALAKLSKFRNLDAPPPGGAFAVVRAVTAACLTRMNCPEARLPNTRGRSTWFTTVCDVVSSITFQT